jgi:hypothetical protein
VKDVSLQDRVIPAKKNAPDAPWDGEKADSLNLFDCGEGNDGHFGFL